MLRDKLSLPYLVQFIIDNRRSLILFFTIGLLNLFFYLGFFSLLWRIGHIYYPIAVSIAYITSVLLYFYAHRHITFKSHQHPAHQQFFRFLIMLGISYVMTMSIVHVGVEWLHYTPYVGMIAAVGITSLMNYFIAKQWVFKKNIASS